MPNVKAGSSQLHLKAVLVFVWSCDLNMNFHFCRDGHFNKDQMSEFSFENETNLFVSLHVSD